MGLDLWFRQDVARILAATYQTMQATKAATSGIEDRQAASYQRGFEDALRSVGVAFGLTEGMTSRPIGEWSGD